MKVKTSITLSEDLLKRIQEEGQGGESRSETIERLLRESVSAQARRSREARDLEIINKNLASLREEALDVLDYTEED